MIEGKVYKYKSGIKSDYDENWLQLTQEGIIKVYKDKISSICNSENPIMAVPISFIEDVKKIRMKGKKDINESKPVNRNSQFMLLYTDDAINE